MKTARGLGLAPFPCATRCAAGALSVAAEAGAELQRLRLLQGLVELLRALGLHRDVGHAAIVHLDQRLAGLQLRARDLGAVPRHLAAIDRHLFGAVAVARLERGLARDVDAE